MMSIEECVKVLESLEFDCISPVVSPKEYVTHEMAIDAGDKSLEGSIAREENWERCGACPQCRFNQIRPDLILLLSRVNKEFIAKTLYNTKVKWEALEDFEKVALPKAGIKLYAEELVQALTNKEPK
jgi:hypothetical protein